MSAVPAVSFRLRAVSGVRRAAAEYGHSLRGLNRNCWLLFLAGALSGVAQGVFAVDFNLYILSLGVSAEALGGILSAAPFAQALASIPVAFISEALGFKRTFVLIFGMSALAKVGQLVTGSVPLIAAASFIDGLAMAGSFVVRLPFLALNAKPEAQTQVYTINSMLFSVSMSLGSLLASRVPALFGGVLENVQTGVGLSAAYRYTLLGAAGLTLVAMIPIFALKPTPTPSSRRPGMAAYFWKIDRFVVHQAMVTLAVGLSVGLIAPFMNLIFLYHLGTSVKFFGTVSALALVPAVLGAAIIPAVATRTRSIVRLVTVLRLLIPAFLIVLALTNNPWIGTGAYWTQNALFFMISPLAFSFAMEVARESRAVLSAWLNVAFWIGTAAGAPVTGALVAQSNYRLPLFLASGASVVGALLNQVLMAPVERKARTGSE
jgi:MFS family permease